MRNAFALCLLAALLCSLPPAATQENTAASGSGRPSGIAWFDGSVTDAFAAARSARKPVFLYWGAAWCPPCQQLKATVFRRRDFLDRLTLFVPLYLDGDAAGAQIWGERFGVSGYPTVLVLRDDQTELERVSGGMDLGRYADVLDLALGQEHSAQELLASIKGSDDVLPRDDCRRLAFNAWQLQDDWSFRPEALGALAVSLERAATRCPSPMRVERSRLRLAALQAALASEHKELLARKHASDGLTRLLAFVPDIVSDRDLGLATADELLMLPMEYFSAAAQSDPRHRAQLRARWFALMEALRRNPRYAAPDRLDAIRSKLMAAKGLDSAGKIPPALAADAVRQIDAALAQEHEPYARSALVNAALNTLEVLGDDERSRRILAGEIQTAANAYYYMADLGELEERHGHLDAAIDWLARSYQEAQGPATRFQWGVGYVRGLVRMRPQNEAAIQEAALSVLEELDAAADLHGRTRHALGTLDASLRQWNVSAEHVAAVAAVRERMRAICSKVPARDSARVACEEFLRDA
jgi:thiol-disulfide isomerase/thioredoxin